MDAREKKILCSRLFPLVRKIDFPNDGICLINDECPVNVETADPDGVELLVRERFSSFWKTETSLTVKELEYRFENPEHYEISVAEKSVTIRGNDFHSINLALYTLRQLAEVKRGSEFVNGYFLPVCEISDEPAFNFRAIHFCVFPETTITDLERKIRLAAYHKYNYAIIEFWGTYRYECFPELGWKERNFNKGLIRHLVKLGQNLGITLCPQFNLLGHAAIARGGNGKHTVLDFHPELEALFEPDGWCWCLSNPYTRKRLSNVVLELLDLFDDPPYFHIGCDEAHNVASCLECRRTGLADLIADHIDYFHNLLKSRQCRTIMWHDMLLVKTEGCSFEHYVSNGKAEGGMETLLGRLNKEIMIADWQYEISLPIPEDERDWPTRQIFREAGFEVLACPWLSVADIRSQGIHALKQGLSGWIQTTWHKGFLYPHIASFFAHGIQAAWDPFQKSDGYNGNLTHHFRQISQDMKIDSYEEAGFTPLQYMPRPS